MYKRKKLAVAPLLHHTRNRVFLKNPVSFVWGDRTLTNNALAKLSEGIVPDIQLAEKLGISGTLFFVMNGEIFSGA